MKFLIETKELLTVLLNASGNIVPKKTILPALENVKLDILDKTISISSSDAEISLKEFIDVKITDPKKNGGYLINAATLSNLIRKFNDETLTFEFLSSAIKIVSASGEFKLPYLPGEDFPRFTPLEEKDPVEIETAILKNYITKALPFTVDDEFKPQFSSIHFVIKDKKVMIEAVDGIKILRAEDKTSIRKDLDILIPKNLASIYSKIFTEEKTKIFLTSKSIAFVGKNFYLYGRLSNSVFPKVETLFTIKREKSIEGNRKEIMDAIERLTILNHDPSKLIKFTFDKKLELSMRDKEYGTEGKEVFLYDYKKERTLVGLNGNHTLTCLKSFKGEKLTISFKDEKTAVVFSDENKAVQTLLAPTAL